MSLPTPPVRTMFYPKDPEYCYWEEFTTVNRRPVISRKCADKKGDYVLICGCIACQESPLAGK